ncbi:SAICAR synthase-like protein, partial [Artomyces pyxidatus]
AHQVGGHAGVQTTADGSLLIKPALPLEHAFYARLAADASLVQLERCVPRFLGTLRLAGQQTPDGEVRKIRPFPPARDARADGRAQSLVLENLACPFARPNVLDVKLGTTLYDEDASPEKRARMERAARETTSLATGMRLTGFQVYNNVSGVPDVIPKAYGKSLAPADLPAGIARFFPVAAVGGQPETNVGLPARTLLSVVAAIRSEVRAIRKVLCELEMRMVGGSLLIIYEAEHRRAEECVRWLKAHPDGVEEDEDEDAEDEDEEEAMEEDEEGEQDDEDEDEGDRPPGPPCTVKLIDFAHTRFKPGHGPDEGVLKGIDTVLALLDGRIEEVK